MPIRIIRPEALSRRGGCLAPGSSDKNQEVGFENWSILLGVYHRIYPSFNCGISGRMMPFDQLSRKETGLKVM